MVFKGSFMVVYGFWLVTMVVHGYWFPLSFKVISWFFVGFNGFSR